MILRGEGGVTIHGIAEASRAGVAPGGFKPGVVEQLGDDATPTPGATTVIVRLTLTDSVNADNQRHMQMLATPRRRAGRSSRAPGYWPPVLPEPVLPEPVLPEPVFPEPLLPGPVFPEPLLPVFPEGEPATLLTVSLAEHCCE